jgi:hypothetical protein
MSFLKRSSLLATALFLCSLTVWASDHKEAPLTSETPAADLNDVYAFLNPNDPSRLVLALTVNPFSVPSEAIAFNFSTRYIYRLQVDNNGDAIADHTIALRFTRNQTYTARFFPENLTIVGKATAPTEEPVANPPEIYTSADGEIEVFAGPRDDPFFFDVVGFNRFLAGTGALSGSDGFAGFNVSAIVVELPVAMVAGESGILNVWASTLTPLAFKRGFNNFSDGRQEDRVGNPAVATALIPSDLKDAYNRARPTEDASDFAGAIVASLQSLGTSDTNIGILASVAVPDVLTIDTNSPTGFPNGRDLDDDVIDIILGLVLNNPEIGDSVDANDREFLAEFPYLAPPWQAE